MTGPGVQPPRPAARPNILMIVADQERWDVLGAYGSAICRTPRLDELASDGVRFETCVAPTGICSPARASLLTGRYPHSHGMLNNIHEPDALRTELPDDIPTFPVLLGRAGYRLGHVGKWHAGRSGPATHGFQDIAAVPETVVSSVGEEQLVEGEPFALEPIFATYLHGRLLVAGIDPRPLDQTPPRRDADAAIGLLERYATLDEPFFLRLDFEGPHHPYLPPEPYASQYRPADIPPWPSFAEDLATKPAAQQRLLAQRGVVGWTWDDWRPAVARYFGFVSFIDAEIGRVLDALDRLDLRDRTVVMHTVDHGDLTGAHGGLFNKGPVMYDEVYRIPLIVRDPRGPVGGVCRRPVGSLALMPTIAELAGVPVPPGVQVDSLLPLLAAPGAVSADGAAFAEYHGEEWGLYSQRMIRTATAKYVYSPHGTDELYDLVADPHELVNRIEDPACGATLRDLRRGLLDWMTRTDDPLALWARRVL